MGITYLAQAQNLDVCGTEGPNWYYATDMLLGGDWAVQWSSYVMGLTHGGIRIVNVEDKLLWMYDEQMGMVTAKKAYELIVCNHRTIMENDIILKIWHFNIPHKLKCFIWLTCNKKINTWDILCKKGWHGPNRCCLFNEEAESVDHLFVGCLFMKKMILGLNCLFEVNILWTAPTFMENLSNWVSKNDSLQYLPLFLIWNIWKARNCKLFEDQNPIMAGRLHNIHDEVNTYKPLLKHRHKIRIIGKPHVSKFPRIFLDGAVAKSIGGAGTCLWLNDHHLLAFKLGCGSSTNTRAELLALWASLRVTKDIGLPYLHIFGDSSVIINWEKQESTLDMVNLEAWCYNTIILMSSFTWVDFSHVYREHNKRAYILSKEGLYLAPGHLLLTKSYDDEIIGEDSLQ